MANEKGPLEINLNLPFKNFDVNEGARPEYSGSYRLPSLPGNYLTSAEEYANHFTAIKNSMGGLFLMKDFASSLPPSTQTFGRLSYMPNNSTSQLGVLQWPGLPPETLQKLAREMISVQMLVNQRCTDILRFSDKSDYPWRPGWQIKPLDPNEKSPDKNTLKEMREAEQFLMNCGYGADFTDPLERDKLLRLSFSKFLLEIVRDSLVYDGIAIWKDIDDKGNIHSFVPLPAAKIRLLARADRAQIQQIHEGQLNFYGEGSFAGKEPTINLDNPPFAVAVDETNNIVKSFTRDELVWYVRNPRVDVEVGGYGYPEIEQALILVTGFNNAIQFNADIFDKNSIPKGILAIKGNFTQRQFDALGRIWDNLQRGQRNDWTLPALQLSEKGAIEIISLEELRKEPAYYNNLINLFMGALATVYCIPVHRLGYKISGTERDSRPDTPKSLQEEEDMGLPGLLTHIELIINDYLIKNRWPHLKFEFTGKTPKEDARLYEVSLLTKTVDERRLMVGDVPYETLLPDDATPLEQLVARLMGRAPVDPAHGGIYQSILAALAKAGAFNAELGLPMPNAGGEGGKEEAGGGPGQSGLGDIPGARFKPKKDPAESEKHGHTSGVRRTARMAKQTPSMRRLTSTYSTPDTTTSSRGSNKT